MCDPSGGALLELDGASRGSGKFNERVKAKEFRKTKMVRNSRFNLKNLRRPTNFEKLGPSAKLRAMGSSNVSSAKMNRFFETGASVGLLKSSRRAIGGRHLQSGDMYPFVSSMGFGHST